MGLMRDAAWIDSVPDDEAEGRLAELYARWADPATGRVDHVLRVHSLDVASFEAHVAVYVSAMRGTPSFPKVEREMVAVIVSAANGCHY